MKIAIIGCGAMGSIYAGLFAEAGHKVTAIDLWREHLQAISVTGLKLTGASGDRVISGISTVFADDTEALAQLAEQDIFIIATKADGVEAAGRMITPLLGPEAHVLTIQNGMGSAENLAAIVPPAQLMIGVAQGFGAAIKAPGHIHHANMSLVRIGSYGGGISIATDAMTQCWKDAGFNAEAYADIDQLIWEKFICNVSLSGPCTISGLRVDELRSDPVWWQIALGCGLEAYNAGMAKQVVFSFDDAGAYIARFAESLGTARPSMALDHLAGRRSEIDVINGIVPQLAAESDLDAPYNTVVSAMVRRLEEAFV